MSNTDSNTARPAPPDEPAVPENMEPAAVAGEPSDEELKAAYWKGFQEASMCGAEASWLAGLRAVARLGQQARPQPAAIPPPTRRQLMMLASDMSMASIDEAVKYARAVLARWGRPAATPPAPAVGEGPILEEVEHLCEKHCFNVEGPESMECLQGLINDALARWGNRPGILDSSITAPAPAEGENIDRSHISDGYHTFAELYDHRHSLMLALMRAIPQRCWFSQRHADGELPFGSSEWFIAGAALPAGAITYHLPSELLSLAQQTGAVELSVGRPWDGHTPNDVIKRLRGWVTSPQPAPAVTITPPPELVEQWIAQIWHEGTPVKVAASDLHIATQAARWGAAHALPLPSGEVEG